MWSGSASADEAAEAPVSTGHRRVRGARGRRRRRAARRRRCAVPRRDRRSGRHRPRAARRPAGRRPRRPRPRRADRDARRGPPAVQPRRSRQARGARRRRGRRTCSSCRCGSRPTRSSAIGSTAARRTCSARKRSCTWCAAASAATSCASTRAGSARAYWLVLGALAAALIYAALAHVHQYAEGAAVVRFTGRSELIAHEAGTIASLDAVRGQKVERGQVLARLHDAEQVGAAQDARDRVREQARRVSPVARRSGGQAGARPDPLRSATAPGSASSRA